MKRKYHGKISCQRISPTEKFDKDLSQLKTVGMKLTKKQALELIKVLSSAVQDSKHEIEITAYRFVKNRKDGTYHVTITSMGE